MFGISVILGVVAKNSGSDDARFSLARVLLLHAFEADNVCGIVLAALVNICLVLRHADFGVDVFALELVEQLEGLRLVAVQILHDVKRLVEFLSAHLLFDHVDFDFAERLGRVRLYCSAHVDDLLTLAFLGALALHLVQDFFEIGVLHESLVSGLRELAGAVLQADQVLDELVFGERVSEHALLDLEVRHFGGVRFINRPVTLTRFPRCGPSQ